MRTKKRLSESDRAIIERIIAPATAQAPLASAVRSSALRFVHSTEFKELLGALVRAELYRIHQSEV